jgi:predicted TIM-barrel fold metal-dependent hydrolase
VIIDCHTHVFKYPGHLSDEFVREANELARGEPMDLNVTKERHWKAMEGVDKVIVLAMRALHSGVFTENQYVADYAKEHPGKIIGFAGVDPLADPVEETLKEAIDVQGLQGVKLGPIYQGLSPTDERMMLVYDFCQSRGLPIMIHQGTTFPRKAPLKFAPPLLLEDVALEFPKLKMIIAHMGHPWMDDTIVLIRKQPNFFADISALHYRPWQFYNALVSAKEYGVLNKLLFGTDYPFTTAEASISAIRALNDLVGGTNLPRLSEEQIEGLIHSPTLELLGLEGAIAS